MKFCVDLATRSIVESRISNRVPSSVAFKRGDRVRVELEFLSESVPVALADGAVGRLGIKARGAYEGGYLAFAPSWTKNGTTYSFDLNLNTVPIATAFSREPASVPAMLELEWEEGDTRTSSKTVPVDLQNDVNRGDETEPVAVVENTPPTSADAQGSPGQSAFDDSFLYLCVAANTWRRAPLSTW